MNNEEMKAWGMGFNLVISAILIIVAALLITWSYSISAAVGPSCAPSIVEFCADKGYETICDANGGTCDISIEEIRSWENE